MKHTLFRPKKEISQRKDRTSRLYYRLTVLLAIALFILALRIRFPAAVATLPRCLQWVCDAAFVTGLALFSFWLLAWSWYQGTLDIFLYAAALMFSPFQKGPEDRNKETRDFATYREQKKAERRNPVHFLVVGTLFLAISLLFYVIYCIISVTLQP